MQNKKIKIAFVVGEFPVVSETFIINQVADLEDREISAAIFSFDYGSEENISERYFKHQMKDKVKYLKMPKNKLARIIKAIPLFFKILFSKPGVLLKIFDFKKYGQEAWSLKLLFWCAPFIGREFDIIHCHFGSIANRFLIIKDILGIKSKLVVSFYGYDVSMLPKQKGNDYYQRLIKEGDWFLVMSENMKERVTALGFASEKIEVLPVSIDVDNYPYKERNLNQDNSVNIFSVGRFVEKKGFDDFIRAMAIVKEKTNRPVSVEIVGGGPLEEELKSLTNKLNLEDTITYSGYMKIEEVIDKFLTKDLFVQPSKTAADGDME